MSLSPNHNLDPNIFTPELGQEPTRNGFGKGLVELGESDPRVVALCADLAESTRMHWFREAYPERYIELGVAEQNLAVVGAGMAAAGKIPFVSSYAAFSPGRNWEQIRTTICLNNMPVNIVGSHAGVSVGADGATHQALEDIALMRTLPNMTVLVPADGIETRKATIAAAAHDGPVYIRLAREKAPVFTTEDTPFEIGKASVLWKSGTPEVAVIACGDMVYQALQAAHELEGQIGVTVINCATIKPLDKATILRECAEAGAVVTVEEHQVTGGLGGAIAELLAAEAPAPIEFVGISDRFGQSGTKKELYPEYGLDVGSIVSAIQRAKGRAQ